MILENRSTPKLVGNSEFLPFFTGHGVVKYCHLIHLTLSSPVLLQWFVMIEVEILSHLLLFIAVERPNCRHSLWITVIISGWWWKSCMDFVWDIIVCYCMDMFLLYIYRNGHKVKYFIHSSFFMTDYSMFFMIFHFCDRSR